MRSLLLSLLLGCALSAAPRFAPTAPLGAVGASPARFIILPFEVPASVATRLPAKKPLLLPFREWLLDREYFLVTSVHRDLDAALRDARREHLDLLLLPSLTLKGSTLEIRMRAIDAATGAVTAEAVETRKVAVKAGAGQIQALLPAMAQGVFGKLFKSL